MNESTANDFYDRIVQGTDYTKKITLTHGSGAELEGVKMHPVNKRILANVISSLPTSMFDAVEEADSPEEAEEMLEQQQDGDDSGALDAMSEDTVAAFEQLAKHSLMHDELTKTQMAQIIEALDFGVLFKLGGEIIDISFADSNAIKDFREQE